MIRRYTTMELNIYKQHTKMTNGRKTTNDALITLLRAGVLAVLLEGAAAGATWVVGGDGGADYKGSIDDDSIKYR